MMTCSFSNDGNFESKFLLYISRPGDVAENIEQIRFVSKITRLFELSFEFTHFFSKHFLYLKILSNISQYCGSIILNNYEVKIPRFFTVNQL
jgi:hypothetical protein